MHIFSLPSKCLSGPFCVSWWSFFGEMMVLFVRTSGPFLVKYSQDQETERRAGNGITRRIKEAKFPIKKYSVHLLRKCALKDAAFLPLCLVDFDKSKYN